MKFEFYSLEQGQETFAQLQEAYKNFYRNDPSYMKIFEHRSKNKGDEFYKKIKTDIHTYLSSEGYSASRLWEFFHLEYKRTSEFEVARVELIYKLINFYTDNVYDPSEKKATPENAINANDIATKAENIKPVDNYRKKLREEFCKVSLLNFSMPIDKIVRLPIFRIDKEIQEKIKLLKSELKELENDADTHERQLLESEVSKMQAILQKRNDIFDVLELDQDIFIESSAGSGKTTLLKWIAYKFSENEIKKIVPIFIELHSFNSDLTELIEQTLNEFNITLEHLRGENLLLLIDGWDEYSGNEHPILIKQIQSFKKKYNPKIVFSGRFRPKELSTQQFFTYTLSSFGSDDIQYILKNEFNERGTEYFEKLKAAKLIRHIDRPLYLIFLIVHLKRQGDFDIKKITSLLVNKGQLMQTVIVEEFITNYESKNSPIQEERWKDLKNRQVELVDYFAYLLTFESNDSEMMSNFLAEKALMEYSHKKQRYGDIKIPLLLKEFEKHSILTFKRGQIGFDIKELRLFFTARYLVNNIRSSDSFEKYRKDFQVHHNSWISIKEYLFGLLEPKIIMDKIDKHFSKEMLVYSNALMNQFEYAYEFLKNGRTDKEYNLLTISYFLTFIPVAILNDLKFEKNLLKKRTLFTALRSNFFRWWLNNSSHNNALKRKISKPLFELLNFEYFHYYSSGARFTSFSKMGDIFDYSGNLIEFINPRIRYKGLSLYEYDLDKNPISLRNAGNSLSFLFTLMYEVIYNPMYRISKRPSHKISDYRYQKQSLDIYIKSCFKLYPTEFLNFYFQVKEPTLFNLKSLYTFYERNQLKITSKILLPEARKKILEHLNFIALHDKNPDGLSIMLSEFIDRCADKSLMDGLLNPWVAKISNKATTQEVKLNLLSSFFRMARAEDVPFFIGLLNDDNQYVRYISATALTHYSSPIYGDRDYEGTEIIQALHKTFCAHDTEDNIRLKMLFNFSTYRIHPSEEFINDILNWVSVSKIYYHGVLNFFGTCRVREATPYLEKVLMEDSRASFWAYEALFHMDYENYYLYKDIFAMDKVDCWISLESIEEGSILKPEINEDFFIECYSLGDEKFLNKLRSIIALYKKGSLKLAYSECKILQKCITELDWKVRRLKECKNYPIKKS